VSAVAASKTRAKPWSDDIEVAPEFREPLRSWIAHRAKSVNATTLDESEIVALKQRLLVMAKHGLQSSARWQVAIVAFLVRHERLLEKEEQLTPDRLRRCAKIEAHWVANWYTSEKWAAHSPAYYIKRLLDYPAVADVGANSAGSS